AVVVGSGDRVGVVVPAHAVGDRGGAVAGSAGRVDLALRQRILAVTMGNSVAALVAGFELLDCRQQQLFDHADVAVVATTGYQNPFHHHRIPISPSQNTDKE